MIVIYSLEAYIFTDLDQNFPVSPPIRFNNIVVTPPLLIVQYSCSEI